MTAVELDNNFKKFSEDLQGDAMAKIMIDIGYEARYDIYERVTKTGTNPKGEKYSPYSTDSMLSGCSGFLNKTNCPATSKTKRKDLKWVTIERNGKNYRLFEIPGGYKQFRSMNNLQTGFVDFSFSNRMWNNIKVVIDLMQARQGQVTIKATTPEDNAKLEGNTKRRGDILMISKSEEQQLADILNEGLEMLIANNGLQ